MNEDDVVIWVDPYEDSEGKFTDVLAKGVGLTVIAIADRADELPDDPCAQERPVELRQHGRGLEPAGGSRREARHQPRQAGAGAQGGERVRRVGETAEHAWYTLHMHRQSGILPTRNRPGAPRSPGTRATTCSRSTSRQPIRRVRNSPNAQEGALTAAEQFELDEYLDVNDFLTIVQSKGRTSLKNHNSAA